MSLRSVRDISGLVPAVTGTLGTVLHRGQRAAIKRAGLHRLPRRATCWEAAETGVAITTARADALVGTEADARVLVATMMTTVAHAGLGTPTSAPMLANHPATGAVDAASTATWLREVSESLLASGRNLYDEARQLAEAVLTHPATTDRLLAEAWLAVCGLSLLETLTSSEDVNAAESRLIQRAVATAVAHGNLATSTRIARLAGVDRQTLAQWLRFGPPSSACHGHHISAPVCAALTGMTGHDWRTLHAHGAVPEARDQSGGTLNWDEGEVLRWMDDHSVEDCRSQCSDHQPVSIPVAMTASQIHRPDSMGTHTGEPRVGLALIQ